MDGREQSIGEQRLHDIAGGKNNVPAGIAAHDAREHLFIAFVDAVADADAELGFEFRDGIGGDVGRPVEDVEARSAIAGARAKSGHRRRCEGPE